MSDDENNEYVVFDSDGRAYITAKGILSIHDMELTSANKIKANKLMDKIAEKYRYSNIPIKSNKDANRIEGNLEKAEIKANRQFSAEEKQDFINRQYEIQQGAEKDDMPSIGKQIKAMEQQMSRKLNSAEHAAVFNKIISNQMNNNNNKHTYPRTHYSNGQAVSGILYDIITREYNLNEGDIFNAFQKHTNNNNQVSDKYIHDLVINRFKRGLSNDGVKVSDNKQLLDATYEIISNQKEVIDALQDKIDKLEKSVVVRKNISYTTPIRGYDANTKEEKNLDLESLFGIHPTHPQPKYVTDTNGINYDEYRKWLKEDPKNKPDIPKH